MNSLVSFLDTFVDFAATGVIHPRNTPPTTNTTLNITPSSTSSTIDSNNSGNKDVSYYRAPVNRIVAIGDLHGDIDAAKQAFLLAKLTDEHGHWTAGSTVCVQVGDVLDRGHHEIKLMYWMERLAEEAKAQGGELVILNGNHEYMNVAGRFTYVSKEGAEEFDRYMMFYRFAEKLKRECNFPHHTIPPCPSGISKDMKNRFDALRPGGPLSTRFLADKDAAVQFGDNVFVHAGILPDHVEYGLDRINTEAKNWVNGTPGSHYPKILRGANSLVWTRLYSHPLPEKRDCALLEQALNMMGARRMIVGHSVHESIIPRCEINGEAGVYNIDVGMSAQVSGNTPSALEIRDDKNIHIIRPKQATHTFNHTH